MNGPLSASRTRLTVLAAALFLAACQGEAEVADTTEIAVQPVAVEALTVNPGGGGAEVRASGLVAYKRETALSFGAPGQIETLTVDAGDQVKAGQVIATLRKTTVGADAAEAALARKTAEQNFDRISRLHEAGAASQSELDNATLALERTRERISVVATASGVVLLRQAQPGQTVSAGQPVITVGERAAGMIVKASLTSDEIARVSVGDAVAVRIRDEAFAGKVERMSPRSLQAGSFEIEVRLDSTENLRSGEVAEISIAAKTADAAPQATTVVVPAIALIDARADQGVVFVIDEQGKARRRAIETGGVGEAGVTILKGLAPGDRVITRGASMVRDGDPVKLAGE
jgi:RND family efflux transporter MFP subunit